MALHNMKRADHCTQPMIWDESLAASAASHAGGCPLSMDTHSTIANVSENVVHAATPSDDPEAVVETLFQSWYDQQLPNYGFATALGPCPGGFRYQTAAGSECIATGANRVEELTRLLWGSHNIMGCAYRGCAVGKVLVCHYSKRDCTGGDDCVGNVPDAFQANVRAVNPYGPGPCTQRAWDDIMETSVRSYATQAHTPAEIRRLLANTIDPATFVESTSTAGLTNASNIATIPVREPLPPSPPWAGAPPSRPRMARRPTPAGCGSSSSSSASCCCFSAAATTRSTECRAASRNCGSRRTTRTATRQSSAMRRRTTRRRRRPTSPSARRRWATRSPPTRASLRRTITCAATTKTGFWRAASTRRGKASSLTTSRRTPRSLRSQSRPLRSQRQWRRPPNCCPTGRASTRTLTPSSPSRPRIALVASNGSNTMCARATCRRPSIWDGMGSPSGKTRSSSRRPGPPAPTPGRTTPPLLEKRLRPWRAPAPPATQRGRLCIAFERRGG